ncbi:hypothetical protein BGZ99_007147 [Dissophora globulifera]|uniref:LRR-containing protein second PH domain-containing protein n=1 Tax=Dissophora globulifera TaxID=979702 RepID=A0A9P6URE5_9FUNG|nr:hypothetical protein BGZ99_007147 [Dissophora globulifera]
MNSTPITPGVRSPQQVKLGYSNSTYSSDEIQTGIPQRPPRPNRQRADSTTSSTVSGSQYYQQYYQQQQQQQQQHRQYQQQQYDYASSSPPSARASPRSTPISYGMSYPSQPSSPMSFQLPPSALAPSREESLRSGSISYQTNNGYDLNSLPIQIPSMSTSAAVASYQTPRMSPGSNGGTGYSSSPLPPLSLPDSFLEEQSDYAEYYSDVGITDQQQQLQQQLQQRQQLLQQQYQQQQQQLQQLQHQVQEQPIHSHSIHRQHTMDYPSSASQGRLTQQLSMGSLFLPSPHMSPAASPLSSEFPALNLDDMMSVRSSVAPRFNTEAIQARPEGYYQGHPHVPVESFLMPTQEQYPPDSVILLGGTASHSEGSLFRKDSKEYLLLTNSSLLKYKTMEKAAKIFGNQSVWSSSSGHQLLTPQQTSLISKDHRILSLNSIVGVHTHQAAGSDMQIQVEYLVSISSQPASMHFTPAPDQINVWLSELRQGCNYHASQAGLIPKGTRQRQWVVDKMRGDHVALPQSVAENDPTALAAGGMWRAYFKSQKLKGVPSQENGSSDAKVSLEGKVVVIAVGTSSIHLMPHNLGNGSAKDDMKDERVILQYPILTIKAIQYLEKDDSFSLTFGTTLRQRRVVMTFASARAREIIIAIRARVESLRWLYPQGRKGIELSLLEPLARPIPVPSKDYTTDLGFEDLLRAECSAMNVDRKVYNNVKIDGHKITVGKVEETPNSKRDYSVDEMKCLLRALRFNTTFKEISFRNISFATLQKPKTLKDGTTRYGLRLDKEFYELVMGNPQVRLLDLHNCNLETSTIGSIGRAIRDGHSAGLRLELLDLFGNNASDGADVMTLAKGVVKHAGTLQALDVGNCQITGDGINQLMHSFVANTDVASHTLETFGIQGNSESKVNSFILDMFLKHSMRLKHLLLSGLPSWSKAPILMAETLADSGGFLMTLDLSGMALHPTTLDQLLSWISSPSFHSMEMLKVEGCGLDGQQFCNILDAIGQSGNAKVEVLAGKNLISDGGDLPESLLSILSSGDTAMSLGLNQTCWSEQALRQLFVSLSQNWSLKKLDLSSVSLASNRDPDVETCKLLGQMVSSQSSRLEELNLQGEETADLTSRIGRNLWRSFSGIGQSRYLTKLNVRRNRFRDEGAHALAEAIRVNQSLVWLDMDENDVTLDGFNAILSAFHQGGTEHVPASSLYYNGSLCYFEPPVKDVESQTSILKESMLETYKTEQETRFMLSNSAGKDSREWKERLAQIIRTRNVSSEAIARLDRAIKGISAATERNKAAMDAVYRDRERRRDRDLDRERDGGLERSSQSGSSRG